MMPSLTHDPVRFLRVVLVADTVSAGAMGVVLLVAPSALLDLLGLPGWLARGAGMMLLPFAALVGWTASRSVPPRAAVWLVIALNAAWAIESIVTVAGGFVAPTTPGVAFVLVQATLVAAFAALQVAALRLASPQAA